MQQGSVLLPFLFAVVVDVITELARVASELLYTYDLDFMSQTIDGMRKKVRKWKEGFESEGLKVNFGKKSDYQWRYYKACL